METADRFKIGSNVYDACSKKHGVIKDIIISREMDNIDEYDINVLFLIEWNDGTECKTNLHCELFSEDK